MNNQKQNRGRHRNNARRSNPARQNFDSNGPGVRIRGNATQVYEKYIQLARDAQGSGDRVLAENMLQHAEHYYRILNENAPDRSQQRNQQADPASESQPEIAEDAAQTAQETPDSSSEEGQDDGLSQTMARGRGRRSGGNGAGSGRGNGRGRRNSRSAPTEETDAQDFSGDSGEAQTEAIGAAMAEVSTDKPSEPVTPVE